MGNTNVKLTAMLIVTNKRELSTSSSLRAVSESHEINLLHFFYNNQSSKVKFWCGPGFKDLVARSTVDNPRVSVEGSKFFVYELQNSSCMPFLEVTPYGLSGNQCLILSTKNGRQKFRRLLGTLKYLLEKQPNGENGVMPNNDEAITIIAYVQRWSKSNWEIATVRWDKDQQAWCCCFCSPHNEEVAGTKFLSFSKKLKHGFRSKEYIWEWLRRRFRIHW